MSSARRDIDAKLVRRRIDPVWLSTPPLNFANDNERDGRLVTDDWGSNTSDRLSVRRPLERFGLVAVFVTTVAILTFGWMFVISLTLVDNVRWALSFFGK